MIYQVVYSMPSCLTSNRIYPRVLSGFVLFWFTFTTAPVFNFLDLFSNKVDLRLTSVSSSLIGLVAREEDSEPRQWMILVRTDLGNEPTK